MHWWVGCICFSTLMKMVVACQFNVFGGLFLCTSRSMDVEGKGSTGRHDVSSGLV